MLFDLPSDDVLYRALLARDETYDGQAFVGVSSTGVFCRLTCPARKPKAENCHFFSDVASCIAAGYRPCKRCRPLAVIAGDDDPTIGFLLKRLDEAPQHRWSEDDIAVLGFDPSTIRRIFKRHFGLTFLEMARQRRLAHGFSSLGNGKVIDAQLDAGFDSPSAFRAAFTKMLGASPNSFKKDAMLRADYLQTPLGAMIAVCDRKALHLLEFADRKALPNELKKLRKMTKDSIGVGRFDVTDQVAVELQAYFAGTDDNFDTPLVMHGSPFTKDVWTALRKIPPGETRSYGALAAELGAPQATRAVARANGANQIALIIPCHRVLGADGSLTGYGGGLWRKRQLLALEKQHRNRRNQ